MYHRTEVNNQELQGTALTQSTERRGSWGKHPLSEGPRQANGWRRFLASMMLTKPISVGAKRTDPFAPAASIGCLLSASSPSAVVRLIVAVVVDAVQCELRGRPLAHVRDKGENVISPTLANGYPSPTVILVTGMSRVVTTISHSRPSVILWPSGSLTRSSMPEVHRLNYLLTQTSTTSRVPGLEAFTPDRYFSSAFAAAQPSGPAFSRNSGGAVDEANYHEATKCLS